MAAQFKAFLYATGGLWKTQQLAGKPAGIFYSTSSHGGWWSRDYSAYCYHSAGSSWNDFCSYRIYIQSLDFRDGASSGSPYGAATFVGDGSRQPTDLELVQAWHQGNIIATITKQLKEAA